MIKLEIRLKLRHRGVMKLCAIEDKTAIVVVASYRSVSRIPVRFKALTLTNSAFWRRLNNGNFTFKLDCFLFVEFLRVSWSYYKRHYSVSFLAVLLLLCHI